MCSAEAPLISCTRGGKGANTITSASPARRAVGIGHLQFVPRLLAQAVVPQVPVMRPVALQVSVAAAHSTVFALLAV